MCGIAGSISPSLSKSDIEIATDKLRHRGPDADGFFFEKMGLNILVQDTVVYQ